MNRSLPYTIESDFFAVHDCIVHGVLNKCRIKPAHNEYDDYMQVGRLALVKAYESFPDSLIGEEHFYQFTGFAFQKVYWAIIDELRKEKRHKESTCTLPGALETNTSFMLHGFENDLIERTMLTSFVSLLSDTERQFVVESIVNELTITEIARKYQVSRKTVYSWRSKARLKYDTHIKVITHEEKRHENSH